MAFETKQKFKRPPNILEERSRVMVFDNLSINYLETVWESFPRHLGIVLRDPQ